MWSRAGVALILGALIGIALHIPMLSLALGLVPGLMASLVRYSRAWGSRRTGGIDIGEGARWQIDDSEALYHARDPMKAWQDWRSLGQRARPKEALFMRHALLLGSPGSGKTQLLLLLARAMIARDHALIVLDPKSAPGVDACLRSFARVSKRPFLSFEPRGGAHALIYDPLRYCATGPEIADRLMALVPGPENGFTGFCRGVVITLSEGLRRTGERPTLKRLHDHLQDAGERLLAAPANALLMHDASAQEATLTALKQLVAHDRTHYQKMTSALMALLSLLTTGAVGDCLDPDDRDLRPAWDLRRAIDQGGIVYVGLDALGQTSVGTAIARLILADIAALSSDRLRHKKVRPLSLMIDEAGEVVSPALLQLLGKGRESSVHILIAIQTLSDLTWHLGDRSAAEVVEGNCGAWFLFRQLDALSRQASEQRLGDIPSSEEAEQQGTSRRQEGFFTEVTHSRGHSRARVWRPKIPAALFAGFRDRECLAHFPDGSLWRVTVPLVEG